MICLRGEEERREEGRGREGRSRRDREEIKRREGDEVRRADLIDFRLKNSWQHHI